MERTELPEITIKIMEILKKKIETREPPKTIWLTDTVYCPRKKIYAMNGIGQRFNETAINKIWLGIIVGEALKEIGIAGEVAVEYRGIKGKIDIMMDSGEPLEVKTAQNLYIPASEYANTHVEQLSRYCLATNSTTGILLYYIPGIKITSMPVYRYRFNLSEVKKVTDERIDMLLEAVKNNDPFILPTTWHSESMDNWECRQCIYQQVCRDKIWVIG